MKAAGQDSSRDRLLTAGKTLFAERGYEATTTAAIAKAAGTSHSQLVKHFKDKQGVMAALLERAWEQLNPAVQLAIDRINKPLDRLALALNMFLSTAEKEPALRAVLALDAGVLRKSNGKPFVSRGYQRFAAIIDGIVDDMVLLAQLRPELNPKAVRAAMCGCLEKFLKDELLRTSGEMATGYAEHDLQKIITRLLVGCLTESRGEAKPPKEVAPTPEVLPPDDEVWIRQYVGLAEKVLNLPAGEA